MTETAYTHQHNVQLHSNRLSVEHYFPSEIEGVKRGAGTGYSVLDIGCCNGGLYNVLKHYHQNVDYTGIDIDPVALDVARGLFSDAEFIEASFPTAQLDGRQFDAVFSYAFFSHLVEWKQAMIDIARLARKTMVLDVCLSRYFPTVADPDVSYSFYIGSGTRVPIVVQNMVQFVNFCFTEFVGAGNVTIFATAPKVDASMHGVPMDAGYMRGVAIIEKDESGKPIFGGCQKKNRPEFFNSLDQETYRLPKATLVLDGKEIPIYPKGNIGFA